MHCNTVVILLRHNAKARFFQTWLIWLFIVQFCDCHKWIVHPMIKEVLKKFAWVKVQCSSKSAVSITCKIYRQQSNNWLCSEFTLLYISVRLFIRIKWFSPSVDPNLGVGPQGVVRPLTGRGSVVGWSPALAECPWARYWTQNHFQCQSIEIPRT